jgi:hypothetical protein
MITCVTGYPTISFNDVYAFFVENNLLFEWNEDTPESVKNGGDPWSIISNITAFRDAIEMMYTAEGVIFLTLKKREDRPYVRINDPLLHLTKCRTGAVEGVISCTYYMVVCKCVEKVPCLNFDIVMTKECFEKEIKDHPGFRDAVYHSMKHGTTGRYAYKD